MKIKKVINLGFKYMSLNLLDKDWCSFPTKFDGASVEGTKVTLSNLVRGFETFCCFLQV